MSFVVLPLLIVAIMAVVGLLVAMYVKDEPWYGALSIFLALGPAAMLVFTHVALTSG